MLCTFLYSLIVVLLSKYTFPALETACDSAFVVVQELTIINVTESGHHAACSAAILLLWIHQVTIIKANQGSHSHSYHDNQLPNSLTLPNSRMVTVCMQILQFHVLKTSATITPS